MKHIKSYRSIHIFIGACLLPLPLPSPNTNTQTHTEKQEQDEENDLLLPRGGKDTHTYTHTATNKTKAATRKSSSIRTPWQGGRFWRMSLRRGSSTHIHPQTEEEERKH